MMAGQLICQQCAAIYERHDLRWRCDCGGVLDLDFRPTFDLSQIAARRPTMWRYREAIPVWDETSVVSFDEGFTPLLPFEWNGRTVWLKQDHLFSTGSYKDRGAAVLISHACELGIQRVVEDSSGNAGCAIAAYCAHAGIECAIYAPNSTSPAKLAQIEAYGATLRLTPGRRENAAQAVQQAAKTTFYASHVWNPFFLHGVKTVAFEICEQLGWQCPDVLIVPVGNGTLLLGVFIGFGELMQAGVIARMPRLVGVQAARCAPLSRMFHGSTEPAASGDTLAEGIAIAEPARAAQIVEAVRRSNGTFLTVSEDDIRTAWQQMGRRGIYIEPTAAATLAGVSHHLETATSDALIVSVLTGHGLKHPAI